MAKKILRVRPENITTKGMKNAKKDKKKRAKAFCEMDKMLRIAKLYSDRVLLAEGKNTGNIGMGGMNANLFKVIITKTYDPPLPDNTEDGEREADD